MERDWESDIRSIRKSPKERGEKISSMQESRRDPDIIRRQIRKFCVVL